MYVKIDVFKKADNKETVFQATTYEGKNYLYKGSQLVEQYRVLINNAKCMLGIWFAILGFVIMNLIVVFEEKSIKSVWSSILDRSATFDVMLSVPLDIVMLILTIPVVFIARNTLKHYNQKINYLVRESDGMIEKTHAIPIDMTQLKEDETS